MSKYAKIFLIVALPIMLGGCVIPKSTVANRTADQWSAPQIEGLAKSLTAVGARVYGSEYCSACKYQEQMFGSAWQYINFVECSIDASETQNAACRAARITLYPTWEFKDGSRLQGVQQLGVLAQKIGFSF